MLAAIQIICLIILGALLNRAAGGGLKAHLLNKKGAVDKKTGKDLGGIMPFEMTWLPELTLGCLMGMIVFPLYGTLTPFVMYWSYLWIETGHGVVIETKWGDLPEKAHNRSHTITPVVDWIANHLGIRKGSRNYCRIFMATKGFLIGLPFGGIPLAILLPLSFELGTKLGKHEYRELLAGASCIIAALLVV